MTSPARPHRRTLGRLAAVSALLALVALGPTAFGGDDDFEFGKKLAEARYFDYARKVFDGIITNANRTDEAKDEARYGLALLRKEEAIAATGRRGALYSEIVELFDGAVKDIAEFVQKNPNNPNAVQARLDVGTIRLAFVQWARELLDDPGALQDSGHDGNKLAEDAKKAVEEAIAYFGGLRPDPNKREPTPLEELASYYYVISEYYKALVEAPCSPAAMAALKVAGDDLEEYIMDHDGQLLAVYAQDIYGLVWWEMGKCADDPEKKLDYYNKAFEWFETCVYTEDEGPDHLRVISSGYYHLAQAGLDAGRFPERNFARDALLHLETMLDKHPTAWRSDNGLRAMVEWSKLECHRGNASQAVAVARDAAERAKTSGKPYLEALANRQLNVYVSGGCGGGSVVGLDPEVLKRVADDLMQRSQFKEAIRAYRTVIGSTSTTAQDFLKYRWHAWRRMATAYGKLGDKLGQALAYEPIHDAWLRGQIPHEKGKPDDENMKQAGDLRRRSEVALKDLADKTGSTVLRKRLEAQQASFVKEYPEHPSNIIGGIKTAQQKFQRAMDLKGKNDPKWKTTMGEARELWAKVSRNPKSPRQDAAFTFVVRAEYELDRFADAAKAADKALAYWDSPTAKAQAEKFDSIRQRRDVQRAAATYWQARAYTELNKPKEVLTTLDKYHERFRNFPHASYPSRAYDLLIQAHITEGNIEEADRYYRILLQRDPGYYNLPAATQKLAGHYNAQREVIQEKISALQKVLIEKRKALRFAEKEHFRLANLLADLFNQLRKAQQAITWWEEDQSKPIEDRRVGEKDYTDAKVIKEDLDKRIPDVQAKLNEWTPKRDALRPEVDKLNEELAVYHDQVFEPLLNAATYYKEWDDSLKTLETVDRDPANVSGFAYMFWRAARYRPDRLDLWATARELYEDYLGFTQVKQKKLSDPDKRSAIGHLGDIYVNLAKREADAEAQLKLVRLAVQRLQNSLADRAADNQLVVEMLADKVLVIRWRDGQGKFWRFALPRPASVDELRSAIRNLGKAGGTPLPEFDTEDDRREFERALRAFQRDVESKDDRDLKGLVIGAGKSAFDPVLYKELANTDPGFRLALAWAYSNSGRDEDVPKALNLALSLVGGHLAIEEGTETWWDAREIQMRIYMDAAERRLTDGTSSADAKQFLERAGKVYTGIAANFPRLGEEEIKGNKAKWEDILIRLNRLREKAGMSAVVMLDAVPPAEAGGTPPADGGPEGGE